MSKNELDLFKRVPLFEGLSARDVKSIYAETKEEFFSAGKVVVAEGDQGGRFYMIIEGHAKVDVSGRSKGLLGPGDYFGDLSLLDRGPRSASIIAETNIVARSLTSFAFLALLDEHASMSRKVMTELCRRLRSAEKALDAIRPAGAPMTT